MHYQRNLEQAKARIGTTLDDRFVLEKLLGMGAAASVFRVRSLEDDTQVAVKLLHDALSGSSMQLARLEREVDISTRLEHQNILDIMECSTSPGGDVFLVMELLDGVSLNNFMSNAGGKLDVPLCLDFTAQILSALSAIHSIDVVHRDLKPDNVFVTRSFGIKLLDFGVARMTMSDENLTRQGTVLGTPSYMAPEQARGLIDLIDQKTDIFSLGATMYRMLTGDPLRKGRNAEESILQAATMPPESIAHVMPALPGPLVEIVDRALSFNPSRRYPSAAAMLEALRKLDASGHALSRPDPPGEDAASQHTPRDALEPPDASSEIADTFTEAFRHIEQALGTTRRRSDEHDGATARLEAAHDLIASALFFSPKAIELRVRPYSIDISGHTAWEPAAPLDAIPYDLYSSGIRGLTLAPGLSVEELRELLDVLALGLAVDLAPEDDLATVLWERALPHVSLRLAPTLPLDDLDEREAFTRDCASEHAIARSVVEASTRARLERARTSLALGRGAFAGLSYAEGDGDGRIIPLRALERLAKARLDQRDDWSYKLPYVLAEALAEAAAAGDIAAFGARLCDLVTRHVHASSPLTLLTLYHDLCARLGDEDERVELTRSVFTRASLAAFFAQITDAANDPERRDAILANRSLRSLKNLTSYVGSGHVEAAADAFAGSIGIKPLIQIFYAYLMEHVGGDEELVGALFATMPAAYCELLIKIFVALDTDAGWRATAHVDRHPDLGVRMNMLEHRASRGAPGVAHSVSTLASPRAAPEVRIRALEIARSYGVVGLTGFLHSRLNSPGFHALPYAERRVILMLIKDADPTRGRQIALELLREHGRGFSGGPNSTTRVLAVEVLSDTPVTPEVLKAIKSATRRRPWNPRPLRDAAQAALDRLQHGDAGR